MCCDLCPEFGDCEQSFNGPECCCPRCPEYEDCPSRLEMDYIGLGEGAGEEELDFWA